MQVKKKMLIAMSSAENLLTQIKIDPGWNWASSEDMLRPLVKAQSDLQESLDPFARQWLATENISEMRKRIDEDKLTAEISRFSLNVDAGIKDLEKKQVSLLVRMHAARKM